MSSKYRKADGEQASLGGPEKKSHAAEECLGLRQEALFFEEIWLALQNPCGILQDRISKGVFPISLITSVNDASFVLIDHSSTFIPEIQNIINGFFCLPYGPVSGRYMKRLHFHIHNSLSNTLLVNLCFVF